MGKATLGPKSSLNAPGSSILSSSEQKVLQSQIVEKVVEVVKEVEKRVEVQVEVVKEVIVDRPVEVIKEVEKYITVEVPRLIHQTPGWAKWAVFIAVVEALVIAMLLELH